LKKVFSFPRQAAVLSLAAIATFVIATTTIGRAQQPPAGAPGAQPPGAPGAPGRGAGGPGGAGAPGGGAPRGGGGGQGGGRAAVDTLGAGPWEFGGGGRGGRGGGGGYRVVVYARNLNTPWGIAFLPNGDMLVTERPGNLRIIRNGVLDPNPIAGLPKDIVGVGLGGLMDVELHPNYAQNHYVYFTYSKAHPDAARCPQPNSANCASTTAVGRAKFEGGNALTEWKDVIVTKGYAGGPAAGQTTTEYTAPFKPGPQTGSFGSRIAFDSKGFMYVSGGDRNVPAVSQDPQSHNGKILRLKDDGTVPPDNPFVNDKKYLPEIYSLGHRNGLGLYFHPVSGDLWECEEGPYGGDEVNIIKAGKNYGWPEVSLGRNYDGSIVGKGFTAPGFEEPLTYWRPAIAISGLSIYNGDKFPAWKGQAFVGAMRAQTGQFVARITFNAKGEPTAEDRMLVDLKQRIREVKPGPDGLIYALTDTNPGAVLRIEPITPPAQ
jgi:glucose/arabinose dehydrogenase